MLRWLTFLLLFQTVASAQLVWEQRTIEMHPSLAETNAVAHFKFKNVGEQPITISSVTSSCGCTVASPDKQIYKAGEEGVITATFIFGERGGLQEKTVTVQTNDPKEPSVTLTLRVHIPAILDITPESVLWTVGETNAPKTIAIKVVQKTPVHILSVKSTGPTFIAELKEKKKGEEYEIEITPKDTSNSTVAGFIIETDLPEGQRKNFHVYAWVWAPEDAQGIPAPQNTVTNTPGTAK